jgi:hypothetical protein
MTAKLSAASIGEVAGKFHQVLVIAGIIVDVAIAD